MPRRNRDEDDTRTNIDLAPFMNVVVILIPMLLLSVVFLQVGVINVTAPPLAPGEASMDTTDDEKLGLTVAVSPKGFELATRGGKMTPTKGCAESGPTVCLADDSVDVGAVFDRADRAFARGDEQGGQRHLDEALTAYDFPALYSELAELKASHPDETEIRLTADPDIPYAMLVRVMDVARFQLEQQEYADASTFWAANHKHVRAQGAPMFSDPILAIAQ